MAEGDCDHSLSKYAKNGLSEEKAQQDDQGFRFSDDPSLEKMRVYTKWFTSQTHDSQTRELQSIFAKERNWEQYHTPRNILLALVGEVGELAEIFQWKGEVKEGIPDFTDKERTHVAQEMSDVMLYLVRLADRCHIDLPSAVISKLEQNRQKYPVDKVYGKSDKYTEYQ